MIFKLMSIYFLSVLYILSFTEVSGLKCWYCNSESDPFCKDPFDNSTANHRHCTGSEDVLPHLRGIPATMCRKIRMKIYGHWRYKRDCARLGEPGLGGDERYCLYRSGTYNIHMEYCTCNDKENCNSGHNVKWSSVLISLCTLLTFFCRYFYL